MSEYVLMELEIRRSIYISIISSALEVKDYEDLHPMERMEIITVIKSYNKLMNKFASWYLRFYF